MVFTVDVFLHCAPQSSWSLPSLKFHSPSPESHTSFPLHHLCWPLNPSLWLGFTTSRSVLGILYLSLAFRRWVSKSLGHSSELTSLACCICWRKASQPQHCQKLWPHIALQFIEFPDFTVSSFWYAKTKILVVHLNTYLLPFVFSSEFYFLFPLNYFLYWHLKEDTVCKVFNNTA